MNSKYQEILSYYEDIKLYKGELSGDEGSIKFQPASSLHSPVTSFAYGIREAHNCFSLRNSTCKSNVQLSENLNNRHFYIKLKAQLFDWKKYICGIEIKINGVKAYENQREFFENVNLGWPTIYIPIKNELLTEGENVIELSQISGETYLLVCILDLISLPSPKSGQQLTARKSVREGDEFALSFYAPKGKIKVVKEKNCTVNSVSKSPLNPEQSIVKLTSLKEPELVLEIDGSEKNIALPEVYPANGDFCMVGTDSDDHRHDDSDETDRIIEIFANTGMGNFWQARPQELRNFYDLSSEKKWEERVEYLKLFNTQMSLTDGENVMPFFPELCGENFVGKHFHEAYLYFCSALVYDEKLSRELFLDVDALKNSESFGQTRKHFCDVLKRMYLSCKADKGLTSVGSPSLLTVYEAESGFERVTIEPVSNINLLIGAVRGAKPAMWGAHVPTDWYFGEPNDLTKAKKFLLAMQLLYMHGVDYIYAENSLFKTNAFSREDWDDEFCTVCRSYLREFYDYTVKNPREGEIKTNLAVLYGNNEYFMWHYDDRMAELPENDDWDITLWGKWKDNRHHKCWRAIDAWLPLAKNQNSKKNIINLNLFSGTPYGNVDIIPYECDYSRYRAIALLGWNTYEDGFSEKILNFAENGGTVFVSYCHFNKTDRTDLPMEYASTESLGIECEEFVRSSEKLITDCCEVINLDREILLVKTKENDFEKVVADENGNAVILRKKIGKGTLYFGTFAEYDCPDGKMQVLKYVLALMGESVADIKCTNSNICFIERATKDGKRIIDLLNMCSNSIVPEPFELILKSGKKIKGNIKPCEINRLEVAE